MGFWNPSAFSGGFFASPSSSGTGVQLDAPISSSLVSISQLAFGFDRQVEGYTGDTVRLKRLSDNAESDFGTLSGGAFDKAAVDSWRAGADVDLVKFYDQLETGKELAAVGTVAVVRSDAWVHTGTTLNAATAALTRSGTDGAVTCNITGGGYLELTTSGLTADNGMEFYMLASSNNRKIAGNDSSDPSGLSGDKDIECYLSYGVATNNRISLEVGGGSGGTYTYMLSRASGSTQNLQSGGDLKANAMTILGGRVDDTEISYYQRGRRIATATTNATNITANAALDNGTLRIGEKYPGTSGAGTDVGDFRFSAIVITQTLTAAQRGKVYARLNQIGLQHRAVSLADLLGTVDELIFWPYANLTSGKVYGFKANLAISINTGTTIGGDSPDWTAASEIPHFGLFTGLKSTDPANLANGFVADSNYFMGVNTGGLLNIDYRTDGGDLAFLIASGTNTTIAGLKSSAGTNTGWHIGQGWHHSAPCFYGKIHSGIDTTGKTNQGVGGGWGDAVLSQADWKYMFPTCNRGPDTREDSGVTLSSEVVGETQTWPIGTDVTWANALTDLGIYPSTPEGRTYPNWTQGFPDDDSQVLLQVANFDAGNTYDPDSPVVADMRTGSTANYAIPLGTGGIGGIDQGVATKNGWAPVVQGDTAGRLQTMPYLSQYAGYRAITAFKAGATFTAAEIEQWAACAYKFWEALTIEAPTNTVAPAITGTAQEGQTLTASSGTWSAGIFTPWISYQWQRANGGWANIADATASTYTLVADDTGYPVRCVVTATLYDGTTSYATSANTTQTTTVAAGPPNNTVAPVVSGTERVGEQLSCSTGTWTGTATISYTYQWQADTAGNGTFVDISGATSSTHTLQAAQEGDKVRCVVTGTNSVSAVSANSNQTGTIAAALDIPTPTSDWRFNESSGTTAADTKGVSGADFTFGSAPTWGSGGASIGGGANTGFAATAGVHYTNQPYTHAYWIKFNAALGADTDISALGTNASTLAGNRAEYSLVQSGRAGWSYTVTDSSSGNHVLNVAGVNFDTTSKYLVVERYDGTGGNGATIMRVDITKDGSTWHTGDKTDANPMRESASFKRADRRNAAGAGVNHVRYRETLWAGTALTDQQVADLFTAGSESTAY